VNNDCDRNISSFGNQTGYPTLSHGVQYMPRAVSTTKPSNPQDWSKMSASTWAHEIGHGLGIANHSQAYKCSVNGPLSDNPDDCVNTRHQHDLMGRRHAATHLNGHFKDFLGWMPEANKTTIINDGCHVVDLYDLAQPADPGQTQFVEIPLLDDIPARTAGGDPIDFDVVTLEFRDAGDNQTELVLTHEGLPSLKEVEDHAGGWTGCLGQLGKYLSNSE